jgi:hypothetical protein
MSPGTESREGEGSGLGRKRSLSIVAGWRTDASTHHIDVVKSRQLLLNVAANASARKNNRVASIGEEVGDMAG